MAASVSTHAGHPLARHGDVAWLPHGELANLLTTPVIYAQLIPFALLDAFVTAYQWLCFPVYGIARVPRRRYFVMDRHRLPYLTAYEKMNCAFCAYANGVLGYVREVTARTEQYWCPIQHATSRPNPHRRYDRFFPYGDATAYRHGLVAKREQLRRVVSHGKQRRGHG
jgi:hypothetical protein